MATNATQPDATLAHDDEAGAPLPRLTELEADIMKVVWERGTVTAAEVRRDMLATRPLAHTTILTVLDKLCAKHVLRVIPSLGRAKQFRPLIDKQVWAGHYLGTIRDRFFGGSSASLVAHLLREDGVGNEELEAIRSILDRERL